MKIGLDLVARFLAVTAVLGLLGCGKGPPETIVLVTIDTLRADHLHFMGYPRPISPFLDRMAEEGRVFENAISSSSTTIASHASLFTSLHPAQHQMVRNGVEMHESLVTMAEIFRGEGWQTAAITMTGFLQGVRDGFDHFDSRGVYQEAPLLIEGITAWLELYRDRSKPALVWLHLFDVHEWMRDDRTPQELRAEVETIEPTGDELVEYLVEEHHVDLRAWRGGREHFLHSIQNYDTKIRFVDHHLEKMRDRLDELGMLERSLWVVTSDHGEGLGTHGVLGHGEVIHQEQLRVPLLLWTPDGRYEGRTDALVSHLDLLPTLAELAEVEIPAVLRTGRELTIQGRSLVPLLEDPDAEVRGDGWQYAQRREPDETRLRLGWDPGEVYAVFDETWKYIHEEGGEGQLYDLANDPREARDLSEEETEIRDRLRARAVRWYARLRSEGEKVRQGEISPEYIEELKALGYL